MYTWAVAGYEAGEYHSYAVDRGVNFAVYVIVRGILQPTFHVYFRMRRLGRRHIPRSGPVILAANHRSFLDPFVIGCLTRRPVYYVAKKELFAHPVVGWLLNRLGAFPIDRGAGDQQAMDTARVILERGDCVVIFPEGTRQRPPVGLPLGALEVAVGLQERLLGDVLGVVVVAEAVVEVAVDVAKVRAVELAELRVERTRADRPSGGSTGASARRSNRSSSPLTRRSPLRSRRCPRAGGSHGGSGPWWRRRCARAHARSRGCPCPGRSA